MTPDGLKPANPFPDERAFDDALVMNFYPGNSSVNSSSGPDSSLVHFQFLVIKESFVRVMRRQPLVSSLNIKTNEGPMRSLFFSIDHPS
jgi:hypothetical protein